MLKSQFKKGLKFGKKVILSKIIGNILIEYGGKSMKKKTLLLFLLLHLLKIQMQANMK